MLSILGLHEVLKMALESMVRSSIEIVAFRLQIGLQSLEFNIKHTEILNIFRLTQVR